ncbi:hypothetical protein GB927_012855 [Shinella sp. CPCC 100929]|uniref:Uncharacterized protein n=1 Tax=Shinella lacus TaxID=2654216 RepID=A0ABT1R6Y2_9HYPH|nr:hypothetical protein [Shinella lacus]MCQ4630935.1 hypothetical protein [Shinella lacus]
MLAEINKRLSILLETRHPEFRDVGRHRGRMSVEDIKAIGVFAPALRIGLFGKLTTEDLPSGERVLVVPFAAAVITAEGDLLDSQDRAIALALAVETSLARITPGAADEDRDWPALSGVGLAEDLSIDIADGNDLDDEGIALWAVLFKIRVIIGENFAREGAEEAIQIIWPEGFDPAEIAP